MKKEIKPTSIKLKAYEIVYSNDIAYGKDKTNVSVTVDIDIDGKIFSRTKHMWQFVVSEYLGSFGAEL